MIEIHADHITSLRVTVDEKEEKKHVTHLVNILIWKGFMYDI